MGKVTVMVGTLLILLGVGGYVLSGMASWTALIPAFFGVLFALLGFLAISKPTLNKHVMHAAVLLALLGLGGSFGGLIKFFKSLGGTPLERPGAVYAQAVMAVVLVVYIVLAVRSFIAARRTRLAERP